jgi:hypothetical protein
MGKQMEGDNRERRRKAQDAREKGTDPSAARVSTGSSKQRTHLDEQDDHATRLETARSTKQPLPQGKRKPSPYPSRGRSG